MSRNRGVLALVAVILLIFAYSAFINASDDKRAGTSSINAADSGKINGE